MYMIFLMKLGQAFYLLASVGVKRDWQEVSRMHAPLTFLLCCCRVAGAGIERPGQVLQLRRGPGLCGGQGVRRGTSHSVL